MAPLRYIAHYEVADHTKGLAALRRQVLTLQAERVVLTGNAASLLFDGDNTFDEGDFIVRRDDDATPMAKMPASSPVAKMPAPSPKADGLRKLDLDGALEESVLSSMSTLSYARTQALNYPSLSAFANGSK